MLAGAGSDAAGAKWQVQNKVGSGGLYGLADRNAGGDGGGGAGPSGGAGGQHHHPPPPTPPVQQVDLVYLRNVVLKFLEAAVAGRTAERDALLPAVAAVTQASPAEFAAMRRVLANTAPAGQQMLSSLMSIKF
jgi:hypothetical protein